MNAKEYVTLRDKCLKLVSEELKKKYDRELLGDLIDLSVQHKLLAMDSLLISTYKGIIGYMNWLRSNEKDSTSFLQDSLHDLAGVVHYERNDGFSPRTLQYVEYYREE